MLQLPPVAKPSAPAQHDWAVSAGGLKRYPHLSAGIMDPATVDISFSLGQQPPW